MNVNRLALTALAAALFSTPVFATDLPQRAPAPVYKAAAPNLDWTGCYLGAEGGGAWGKTKQTDQESGSPLFGQTMQNTHVNGGFAGGTAGCNLQTGNFVWGIEGDLSWADIDGSATSLAPFSNLVDIGAKIGSFSTVRARAGFAVDRSFWYVTGGAAFANVKATEAAHGAGTTFTQGQDRTGWTAGGGVEWALPDPHWSVKVEYLYVDFGNKFYDVTALDLDRNVRLNENIVRAGLNYRFSTGARN